MDLGSKLLEPVGATMNEVIDNVKRVIDIMGEIMAASNKQIVGIKQVTRVIVDMDQAKQQNPAS
ncbi:hypothetical protein ACFQUU_17840 [Herbaspirillum sp. GCM10030257]|uniref:hypothetical protein n=1 Tax=Herbaspirillum sp. GCM10030257 TaxID=3273393 RepID=UPI0036079EF0